jgi:heme/copper-type cytochrome/quinol oxidase subunit 2/mono/diheme cytochrome c family protein
LTPHSPGTGQINTLIWIGFFAALIVFVAINLGLFGMLRRFGAGRGRTARPVRTSRGIQWRVGGGLAGFAILLFVLGIIFTSNATSTPKTTSAGLTSFKGKKLEGPLVIHATGQQWLWRYDYPNGAFTYYKLVIPAHTAIELDLESTDVIHTWSVPDLAPKADAVPGKVNHVVFRADAEGEFFGQSSTLSGQGYAPMRTTVEVVSPERFEEFIVEQQKGIKAGQEAAEKIETQKNEELAEFEAEEAEANGEAAGTEGEELVGPEEESEGSEETEEVEESESEESAEPKSEEAEAPEEEGAGEEPKAEEGGEEAAAAGAPNAEAGEEVFAENCSVCHGATGHGGNGGPDLTTMPKAKEQAGAEEQVTNGGGGMPAFGGTLSEEEISNVAAYVVEDIVGGK